MTIKTIDDLSSILIKNIQDAVKSNNKTVLFLTGGKSIQELYKSNKWNKIFSSFDIICFADERIVPISNPESNLGNFLRLTKNHSNKVLKVLYENDFLLDVYYDTVAHFLKSKKYKCYAISSFGLDGHFWSLFTKSDLMNSDLVFKTKSNNHLHERVTLGVKAFELLDSNYFFATEEKLLKHNLEPKDPVKSFMNEVFIIKL